MTILECQETRLLYACRASQLKQPIHPHHAGPHSDTKPLLYTDLVMHHQMSDSQKHHQDIFSLARSFPNDPATKVSTFDIIASLRLVMRLVGSGHIITLFLLLIGECWHCKRILTNKSQAKA